MDYEESAQLVNDPAFRGRVKIAALRYADAIFIEAVSVAGHNTRVRWAQRCFQMPDTVAQEVVPPVVIDAAVQDAGKDITDQALQGAVEAVVQKMM